MQQNYQKRLSDIENLIRIQRQSIPMHYNDFSDYQVGLYNGLILAHAILVDQSPSYIIPTTQKLKSKIRHKGKND